MRYLVTGATGYIGSRLTRNLLLSGDEVHVTVRPSSDLGRIDARARPHVVNSDNPALAELLRAIRPEVVVHLAAATSDDAADVLSSNIVFGARLLDAMAHAGCEFLVNAGTYWEFDSEGAVMPNTLYAATKHALHPIIQYYTQAHRLRVLTLYVYDSYGPGDWRQKLIPRLLHSVLDGGAVPLTMGHQNHYFIHVEDVCAGIRQAVALFNSPQVRGHKSFALRPDHTVSVRELVSLIECVAGVAVQADWGAIPYPRRQVFRPASGIAILPQWRATRELQTSLAQILGELRAARSTCCLQ